MSLDPKLHSALILSLALAPLACGGGEIEAPPPASADLAQLAATNSEFSTLARALDAAGLRVTLEGPGPFTVFAPTNAAFAKIPAAELDALLADQAALRRVLTYHVVSGAVSAATVVTLTEATTVEGGAISISVRDGVVLLNGSVAITATDLAATNGVLHVIDTVLLPPAPAPSILDVAASRHELSILAAAVTRAGLAGALDDGSARLTVFAPTDAAFAASGITREAIDTMTIADLTRVLGYHVLPREVRAAAVTAGPALTLAELTLFLGTPAAGKVTLNGGNTISGGAEVHAADVLAGNGVIHVIDRVLLPPTIPQLAVYGGLTTLVDAVTSAGLAPTLSAAGPFTVFAPTNAAFAALPAVPTGAALGQVLGYHVVMGQVLSGAVPARAPSVASNRFGDNLTLLFDTRSGVVINGRSRVVTADLRATNGVVHVVDAVILPLDVVGAATAAGLTGLLDAVRAAAPLHDGNGTTVASALSADAPYTVFAPTNEAFAAASNVIAMLTPGQIRDVLLYHVLDTHAFPEPVLAAGLPSSTTPLATLNGQPVQLVPESRPITVGGRAIVSTDLVVTNGVIHVIDGVMVPAHL